MSKKADLIDKKVTLITLDDYCNYSIENFEQCYLFRETYSIRGSKLKYYCKGHDSDYFASYYYALVLNPEKIEEAKKELFKNRIDRCLEHFEQHQSWMKKINERIKRYKEIRDDN